MDARHLRLSTPGGRAGDPEQVGDLIVMGAEYAPHGSAAHAVECSRNVNVRLEHIDLFASNCFGFLESDCDGSTYYRCRIDRLSAVDDPVKRAEPRLRSLDADAFHSKRAVKGPVYSECTARFMGDDCVNICGDYHLIMGTQGRELRVLAKHDMNLQPGDPVELVTYDGRRLPEAQVVSILPIGTIRGEERAFLAKQRMDADLKAAKGALNRAFTVTLDREVTIPMGGVIGSASRMGHGFAVKNCNFGFNRSRGILIKASHGEVSGNRIEGCEMAAILVAPEYWWLEAGSSSDLRITGNTIIACKGIPICIGGQPGYRVKLQQPRLLESLPEKVHGASARQNEHEPQAVRIQRQQHRRAFQPAKRSRSNHDLQRRLHRDLHEVFRPGIGRLAPALTSLMCLLSFVFTSPSGLLPHRGGA